MLIRNSKTISNIYVSVSSIKVHSTSFIYRGVIDYFKLKQNLHKFFTIKLLYGITLGYHFLAL